MAAHSSAAETRSMLGQCLEPAADVEHLITAAPARAILECDKRAATMYVILMKS